MLKVKITMLLFISAVIFISDLIITPLKITYAFRPLLFFSGVILVSCIDQIISKADDSVRLKERFYYTVIALFALGLIANIIFKRPMLATPFLIGAFIQTMIFWRGLKNALKLSDSRNIGLHESPMPDVGFKVMSAVLFLRDKMLNHRRMLEAAGIKYGDKVLDYGCGPGAFSLAAAKVVGDDGVVYALDNQHLAIESVRAKAASRGLSNVTTIYTNQGETKLPDDSVDFVLLIGVLHIVRNPDNILKEITRVMKSGGKLLLVSVHIPENDLLELVAPFFEYEKKVRSMHVLGVKG